VNALLAASVGVLAAAGTYLVLRARTYPVVLGLMLLGYAANLLLLAPGRLRAAAPPVLRPAAAGASGTAYADPVPQALVLTAIVIGFGMSAFLVVLAIRARVASGTDHVDGRDGEGAAAAGGGA
jgi:multicomponent K+:H+ antiporter subunit C